MKRTGFLGLFFLTLLIPVGLLAAVSSSTSSTSSSSSTGTTGTLDQATMVEIIRPMLETYARRYPDEQVRIWSLIILANLNNISTGGSTSGSTGGSTSSSTSSTTATSGLNSIPFLVRQMGSRDENIRMIAMDSLRKFLNLDDASWRGIMTPVLLTLAKKAKYVESKKLAIKALSSIQKLGGQQLSLLPMLFELAQNEDAEIRDLANASIAEVLASGVSGGPGGPGGGLVGPR